MTLSDGIKSKDALVKQAGLGKETSHSLRRLSSAGFRSCVGNPLVDKKNKISQERYTTDLLSTAAALWCIR